MIKLYHIPRLLALLPAALALPVSALAGVVVTGLHRSPDISLLQAALLVNDEDVVLDGPSLAGLGTLPKHVDVTAYHVQANGDRLFALSTSAELPGPQFVHPADVVRYDGVEYQVLFDGRDEGLPAGARIDALTMNLDGDLLMSFDITVMLGGQVFADEDLVLFDGANFNVFFDGSLRGLDTSLDLDGAHFDYEQNMIFLSFDCSGTVSGIPFADEDVLGFVLSSSNWNLAFDASAADMAWIAADLDAVYALLTLQGIFKDGFE